MVINPTIEPKVDVNQNPDFFWLNVAIQPGDGYKIVSHTPPIEVPAENKFYVDVNIESSTSGPHNLIVELGDLDSDTTEKHIHVKLVDETDTIKGEGVVSTEEAQQESRPGNYEDLPD